MLCINCVCAVLSVQATPPCSLQLYWTLYLIGWSGPWNYRPSSALPHSCETQKKKKKEEARGGGYKNRNERGVEGEGEQTQIGFFSSKQDASEFMRAKWMEESRWEEKGRRSKRELVLIGGKKGRAQLRMWWQGSDEGVKEEETKKLLCLKKRNVPLSWHDKQQQNKANRNTKHSVFILFYCISFWHSH